MTTKKEEEVEQTEKEEEVKNEEGEKYAGGSIPRVAPPEESKK